MKKNRKVSEVEWEGEDGVGDEDGMQHGEEGETKRVLATACGTVSSLAAWPSLPACNCCDSVALLLPQGTRKRKQSKQLWPVLAAS